MATKELTVLEFLEIKRKHGRIIAYCYNEGGDWYVFKKEFGMPSVAFHAVKFEDGRVWDEINGLRPE